MSISQWPKMERPRERLLIEGAASLSDAQLIAIFLGTGIKGKTALDLARELLISFGNLGGIVSASCEEFCAHRGAGVGKYALLQAAHELSQRQSMESIQVGSILTSSAATKNYLRARFRNYKSEVFSCLYLNNQHHVVKFEELFRGTIDGAAVYPREVVRRCLYHNAAAVIFAHNHPSGIAEPSQADIAITVKLKIALETIDVRVLDHLVVGNCEVVSFSERGLL
ncbi:MAG: hypothetical protein COC19_03915 [SAR86 cluster bacterium]|uniref:MPN domain-containing protein n=1 Tax=SAR86 cluster bacterium TaxID=2030880 RepID=A0A2A4MQ86_9GAMM|nr:MAG: hypothetical protein COC19_03915 [SAR86 cluster bacterium]